MAGFPHGICDELPFPVDDERFPFFSDLQPTDEKRNLLDDDVRGDDTDKFLAAGGINRARARNAGLAVAVKKIRFRPDGSTFFLRVDVPGTLSGVVDCLERFGHIRVVASPLPVDGRCLARNDTIPQGVLPDRIPPRI